MTTLSSAPEALSPLRQEKSRWPIGLLLVAAPVILVIWLVIWPIVSAIIRTVWLPTENGHVFSLRT
jgi:putative spermidine/putrescine transport system permease protein